MFCVCLVLLVLAFLPTLQPQIAKVNVCSLLCFTRFLDSYQHFTFGTVFQVFFPSMCIMLVQAVTFCLQGQFLSEMLKYKLRKPYFDEK